jgi:hypothetical protein
LDSDEDDSGDSDADVVHKTDFVGAGAPAAALTVTNMPQQITVGTVTNMPQQVAAGAAVHFTNPPQDKA